MAARAEVFVHVPHPHIQRRKTQGPVKVVDQHPKGGNPFTRFNTWFAVRTTNAVGTMICAYVFGGLALVSLPSALRTGDLVVIVAWISQTFFQLVLLSVIMVGQNVQAAAADKRSEQTYEDAEAVLHECEQLQAHLTAQDKILQNIIAGLATPGSAGQPQR